MFVCLSLRLSVCLLLCLSVGPAVAFFPSRYSVSREEYSQDRITEEALDRTFAFFIKSYIKPSVFGGYDDVKDARRIVQDYYRLEPTATSAILENRKKIKSAMTANLLVFKEAKYSFSNEEINEANKILKTLQISINTTMFDDNWQAKRSEVLSKIGMYFYTLQEFYSNTNWVEMMGPIVYEDLGMPDKNILPTRLGSSTCTNCKTKFCADCCKNNLIKYNANYLTSGYKNYISLKPSGLNKCNHLWTYVKANFEDDDGSIGGLGKETADKDISPHWYLHSQAGEAAVAATTDFLIGNNGLLHKVGESKFGQLFQLFPKCKSCDNPDISMVFVIDTTGSMSEEIKTVRQALINIVSNGLTNQKSPKYYVLSAFSDPVEKNSVRQTRSGTEMKDWATNLKADGGGDCPEFAMAGLIAGINAATNDSCLFFFTDADAKDADQADIVIDKMIEKNIHGIFMIQGQCGKTYVPETDLDPATCISNRFDDSERRKKKRNVGTVFERIAAESGGIAIKVSKEDVSSVFETIINNNVGVHSLGVELLQASMKTNTSIEIGGRLSLVSITIESTSASISVSNFDLFSPNGQIIFNGNNTIDAVSSTKIVITLTENIIEGKWTILNKASSNVIITIRGKGDILLDFSLLQVDDGILHDIITDSPLAGSNVTLGVSIEHTDDKDVLDSITLVNKNGKRLKEIMIMNTLPRQTSHQIQIQVPSEPFYVAVGGKTSTGNFQRIQLKKMIEPSECFLRISAINGSFQVNKSKEISFEIECKNSKEVEVNIFDSLEYVVKESREYNVKSENSVSDVFEIMGTEENTLSKVTISLAYSSNVIQKVDVYVFIPTNELPVVIEPLTTLGPTSKGNCNQCFLAVVLISAMLLMIP